MKTTRGMQQELNGARRSKRMIARGLKRVYYLEKQDDIEIESSFLLCIDGHPDHIEAGSVSLQALLRNKSSVLRWSQKKRRTRRLKPSFYPSIFIQAYPVPQNHTIDSFLDARHVYNRSRVSSRQARVPRMTIQKTSSICMTPAETHKQQLSTQSNFISAFRSMEEPDTLRKMDIIDQDICPSHENINVTPMEMHPVRRRNAKMHPVNRYSGACTVNVARALNAGTLGTTVLNISSQAAKHQDQELMQARKSSNLQGFDTEVSECERSHTTWIQNQEHRWMCTWDRNYPSELNASRMRRISYPFSHQSHENLQRETYTNVMTERPPSYDTEMMQSYYRPGLHRQKLQFRDKFWSTEHITVADDCVQRLPHSIQQGVHSSITASVNPREKRTDMTCPQMQCSTSSANLEHVIQQNEPSFVVHTTPTAHRNFQNVMEACLPRDEFNMQTEPMTLLQDFNRLSDSDAAQEHFFQQSFTSNIDLLNQLESYDVNMLPEFSSLGIQNLIGIPGHQFTSIKNLQDLEMHSNGSLHAAGSINLPIGTGMHHGSSEPCTNVDANNDGLSKCDIKRRSLRAVLRQIRKEKEEQKNEEFPQKRKKKKIRCKVLKDKTKSRTRQGKRSGKRKNTIDATLSDEDGKTTETEILCTQIEKLRCSSTENFFNGNSMMELSYNLDECTATGTTISNHKETATDIGESAASRPGLCELIDFLGLSDEKHHVGEKHPTNLTLAEDHPHHVYSNNYELSGLQQSSDNFLPLCPFYGDTSSTGSNDSTRILPLASDNLLPLSLFYGETSSTVSTDSTRILPLASVSEENDLQLVLCNQRREIVVSRPPRTQKKIRARVQLDPESHRVWLQLQNGGSLETDTDPHKTIYWEKARQDMKRKVEFFIEKMHFVQGDRRFSAWKGSIVDSVVGAFLTQNVSDHLSSSAYMAVASRFPPKKKTSSMQKIDTHATPFQQCDRAVASLIMGINIFCSVEEQENNSSVEVTESMSKEVVINQVSGYSDLIENKKENVGTCEIQNIMQNDDCYDTQNAPDSQLCGKGHSVLLPSDDEKNTSPFNTNNDESTMEEVSAAFQQTFPLQNSNICRMLHFDDVNKQNSLPCSGLKTKTQVSFALHFKKDVVSDNVNNQQNETESAIASSSSVQSMQDSNSNLRLTTIQETTKDLNDQADMMREIGQAQHVTMVNESRKKRPHSISSIKGIERAQLEANQKGRKKTHHRDWESIRRELLGIPSCTKEKPAAQQPSPCDYKDSVDWDAVRLADLADLAETIKERGMHHVLSGRIKAFLTSLHEEHGSVDLEWLRCLSTEMAREYLMGIHGLGVKSVECIRLLTLHHLAFPVDTNVGRICVRLGWVPIEPLPEEVQLHLVELYPVQETIQKYLWPRLCTLDQRTLYELHYQLITFGKVFCTKSKPNCNACPMRMECKHFASAYASAKPLLTGPSKNEDDRISFGAELEKHTALYMNIGTTAPDESMVVSLSKELPLVSEIDNHTVLPFQHQNPSLEASHCEEFYVQMPASPEQAYEENVIDLEDIGENMYIYNDCSDYCLDLIAGTLYLDQSHPSREPMDNQLISQGPNIAQIPLASTAVKLADSPNSNFYEGNSFSANGSSCNDIVSSTIQGASSNGCSQCNITSSVASKPIDAVEDSHNAIVAMPEAAQIPAPKLKNIGRLRTIHYVYELPDDHYLLKSVDPREKDDPCSYLLAMWSPGETPESQQEIDELCNDGFVATSRNDSSRSDETVAGTLLIPCRTAMRGSFPLNGTYFQVNEVFADHASSLHPLQVPRSLIWNLRRRFVYFGTSIPNIFKGLSTDEIKDCFWRGHVCVRGFDRQSRAPKPLVCRLHFPISKQPRKTPRNPNKKNDEKSGLPTVHI